MTKIFPAFFSPHFTNYNLIYFTTANFEQNYTQIV